MDQRSTSLRKHLLITFVILSLLLPRLECKEQKNTKEGRHITFFKVLAEAGIESLDQLVGSSMAESTTIAYINQIYQIACNQGRGRMGIEKNVYWAYDKYASYGCNCGGFSMGTPVDETDRCCRSHNTCYDKVFSKWNIPILDILGTKYTAKCDAAARKSTCDDGGKPNAALNICMCDLHLAECMSKPSSIKAYDSGNKNLGGTSRCFMDSY